MLQPPQFFLKPPIRIFWVFIFAAVLGFWWMSRSPTRAPAGPPQIPTTEVGAVAESGTVPADVPSPAPEPAALAAPTPVSLDDQKMAFDAIDHLEFTFRDYAAALGGNPVGTNAEITAALLGDNLKQLKLPIPAGSSQNERAELCDPWGTPWFFHQLSGTQMEIRTAGPDRVLYTGDDFVR